MYDTEIIHAVLQISHVAEKIFRHFTGRFDGTRRCNRRPVHRVGSIAHSRRWRGMSGEICGDHDEQESPGDRYERQKVGI